MQRPELASPLEHVVCHTQSEALAALCFLSAHCGITRCASMQGASMFNLRWPFTVVLCRATPKLILLLLLLLCCIVCGAVVGAQASTVGVETHATLCTTNVAHSTWHCRAF